MKVQNHLVLQSKHRNQSLTCLPVNLTCRLYYLPLPEVVATSRIFSSKCLFNFFKEKFVVDVVVVKKLKQFEKSLRQLIILSLLSLIVPDVDQCDQMLELKVDHFFQNVSPDYFF